MVPIFRIGATWAGKWSRHWPPYKMKMGGLKSLRLIQQGVSLSTSGKQMFMGAGQSWPNLEARLRRVWPSHEIAMAGWNCSVSIRERKAWVIAGKSRQTQMIGQ